MSTIVSIVLYVLAVFFSLVTGQLIEEKNAGSAKFGLVLVVIFFGAGVVLQVSA